MKSRSTKKFWIAGAALAMSGALWGVSEVQAQQTTNLVPYDSITMEPNHSAEEGEGTVYAGISECETLIEGDREVEAYFETVSEGIDFIVESRTFGGLYHYRTERGEASGSTRCANQDGDFDNDDCEWEFSSDDYELLHTGVEVTIPFTELTDLDDPSICEEGDLDREYYIQLQLRRHRGAVSGDEFTEYEYADVRVIFDLIRPESPELIDAFSTQNTISVEFEESESEDVGTHHVIYSTESFAEGDLRDDIEPSTTRPVSGSESGDISVDLSPGDTIYVGMLARDEAGNYSVTTEPMEVTVVETKDFWDFYVDGGGDEEGGYGCQSAQGEMTAGLVALALSVLMALGFFRRRDKQLPINAVKG